MNHADLIGQADFFLWMGVAEQQSEQKLLYPKAYTMHVINGCSVDNIVILKKGKPAETLDSINNIPRFSCHLLMYSLPRSRF